MPSAVGFYVCGGKGCGASAACCLASAWGCFPGIYASIQLQDVADFLRDAVQPERAALSVILPKETEGGV